MLNLMYINLYIMICKAFDCVHFINALVLTDVYFIAFQLVIAGFADTLPFYRHVMPERKKKQTSVQSGSAVP